MVEPNHEVYNRRVARGWESKSVEEQQAEAAESGAELKPRLTAQELARKRTLDGLLLSRSRIVQQLGSGLSSHYRDMLERALADLNIRISRLGQISVS
jgi:hypothetical protein